MPGVHVRSIGKSDRARTRQTQPTLNVPGSYWLSHKQNIYKFTFKYHESTRESKEFLHKDELMKVIRRIIKCQPHQGQLSSVHLSITYKHTFWTRQDKMFAMLKFRNRQGVAVFPQAFILTIFVVENPESQINGVVIKSDPNLVCKDSSLEQSLPISPNLANTEASNEDVSQQTEDNKNFTKLFKRSNLQNNFIAPTTMSVGATVYQKSLTPTDCDGSSNVSRSLGSTKTWWTGNKRRGKRRDTWTSTSQSSTAERYNDSKQGDTSTNVSVDDCQKASSQEFFHARPCSKWYKSSNSQATGEGEIGGLKIDSEPITPRSSNITDQVMEGLMFTIKQVEDNVRVVEQRTKMELDEVLENSEKVETKEGERCLVNSSLLRLENLVTKIEIPDKQLKDPKIGDAAPVIDSLTLLSYCSVLDYDDLSTTRCLAAQPIVEKQANIPVCCTNRLPLISSLEPNCNNTVEDQVLDKFFPSMDELKPVELTDVKLTKELPANFIAHKMRKFLSQDIDTPDLRKLGAIENKNMNENSDGSSSSGSPDDDDDDDDDNDDNNNNNNNNNNTNNITNGEVQIDMWKLLQDITRGAKVMVERISDIEIRNATRRSKISGRRILTRSKK